MLLDNYYNLELERVYACASKEVGYSVTPSPMGFEGFRVVDVNGVARTTVYSSGSNSATYASAHRGVLGVISEHNNAQTTRLEKGYSNIICGNGTTPATAADYALENQLVDEIAHVSFGVVCDVNKKTATITKTFQNVSDGQITVSEIGFIIPVWDSTNTSGAANCLVAREVLTTPITVEAGATFTVPMVFKL